MISKAIIPKNPDWEYQHKIADQFFQSLADAVELILTDLGESIDIDLIEEALKKGKPAIIIDSINWADQFEDKLLNQFVPVYDTILAMVGAEAWKQLSIPITFNIRNPYAEKWITENAARLVVQVTDETKAAIRRIILEGFQSGFSPRQMAKPIREIVGLTEREAAAVLNYWEKLNQEADLSQRRVDDMANTYERQLLRKRALRIAGNETTEAASHGVYQSWLYARKQGFILPETKRVWIAATQSDRTCKICMDFDGRTASLDEPFKSPKYGERMVAHAHIVCRCAEGLVTE